jgi:hypothetical protein
MIRAPILPDRQYGHGRALRIAFSSLPHQEYTLLLPISMSQWAGGVLKRRSTNFAAADDIAKTGVY